MCVHAQSLALPLAAFGIHMFLGNWWNGESQRGDVLGVGQHARSLQGPRYGIDSGAGSPSASG